MGYFEQHVNRVLNRNVNAAWEGSEVVVLKAARGDSFSFTFK
jgi:hypothetical protein